MNHGHGAWTPNRRILVDRPLTRPPLTTLHVEGALVLHLAVGQIEAARLREHGHLEHVRDLRRRPQVLVELARVEVRLELARARGEKAIYDFANAESIYL